ncbi:MAG TPA: MerR family transcriptional regulator [Solirubrobacteraceae bacterium]|nr:MerR family transcriptional regulator [Solirubrobacteraceae bacterium]
MAEAHTNRLRRSTESPGYWLEGKYYEGFADDPLLPEGHRRRIAAWARKAGTLSVSQQALLESPPTRGPSAAQQQAEALAGSETSPMWRCITEEEQQMVRDPGAHPMLAGVSYPLGIGQLASLTGSTHDQIRHWHELGLLRARRSKGGHRQFFANAVLRAFFLRRHMSQPYITVLRDISKLEGAPLLAGMATLLHEQASRFDSVGHDLLTQTAQNLDRVSTLFAGRPGTASPIV